MPELAATLRARAAREREACRRHPFVRGLADGSLPPEIFTRWVRQDWVYLQHYARALAFAAARAPDPDAMARWSALLARTLHRERDMHRELAARWGVDGEALAAEEPWAATRAYATFLLGRALGGSYAELLAALLPSRVGYSELARDLARVPGAVDGRYGAWIESYAEPSFVEAARWMEVELDRAAHPEEHALLAAHYRHAASLEVAFWSQLWEGPPAGHEDPHP